MYVTLWPCSIIYNCEDTVVYTCVHIYTRIYTYTIGYYSAISKNTVLSFVTTWMHGQGILLGEISLRKTKTV